MVDRNKIKCGIADTYSLEGKAQYSQDQQPAVAQTCHTKNV